jgi:putative membrane protein
MNKSGWIIGSVVVGLVLLVGFMWLGSTGASPYSGWGMMGGDGRFPMMGFAGGVGMLLFLVLVIGGIVFAVSRSQPSAATLQPAGETSLEILNKRYAAGEIAKEQFDEMKRSLDV